MSKATNDTQLADILNACWMKSLDTMTCNDACQVVLVECWNSQYSVTEVHNAMAYTKFGINDAEVKAYYAERFVHMMS